MIPSDLEAKRLRLLFPRRCLAALAAGCVAIGVIALVPHAPVAAEHDSAPVVVASGWSAPDTAVAAALAVVVEGQVLHAYRDRLGATTAATLRDLGPQQVYVIGGPAAVPDAVLDEIARALPRAEIERVSGAGRVETAAQAALLRPTSAGKPVVLASGWSPWDGAVAAATAAGFGGSVLHSYPDRLGSETVEALVQLAPEIVIIVGGTDSVPDRVRAEIASVVGSTPIVRVAGSDRTETAARAAGVRLAGHPVVLASGWSAADGSAAAALAAALGGSVLHARPDGLGNSEVALRRLQPAEVFIVGGPAALSPYVQQQAQELRGDIEIVRIFGSDRVETAAEVALFVHQRSRDGRAVQRNPNLVYEEPLFDPFTSPTRSGIDLERLRQSVETIKPGRANCDAAPALMIPGISVVQAPANLNDPEATLTVVEVVRIAGGCLIVDYVELDGRTLDDIRELLTDEPSVHAVGQPPRDVRTPQTVSSEPFWGPVFWDDGRDGMNTKQWHLTADITVGDPHVGGDGLWEGWNGANPVTVAILDTGVDTSHPDLDDRIADAAPGGCHHTDQNGHGTHVAGIVAAERNGSLVAGVAPKASILPLRVLNRGDCPSGSGAAETITPAIAYAVNNGARVINMSLIWRSPDYTTVNVGGIHVDGASDDTVELALRAASMLGVVSVAAVGNCGDPLKLKKCKSHNENGAPAIYPDVVAVARIDNDDIYSEFSVAESSSKTPYVEVAAPGGDIRSTFPVADPQDVHGNRTCTVLNPERSCEIEALSGTSMAAPFVAGIVAHLLNRHPDATTGQIRSALRTTAVDVEDRIPKIGKDDEVGWGVVDPLAALARLSALVADSLPTDADFSGALVAVSASGENTCGLRASGAVQCWGDNRDGRSVPPSKKFRSISASRDISDPDTGGHACGIIDDGLATRDSRGIAQCWGFGTTASALDLAARGSFTQVSAGRTFTCGLRPDTERRTIGNAPSGGHAVCWDHLPTSRVFADGRSSPPTDVLFKQLSPPSCMAGLAPALPTSPTTIATDFGSTCTPVPTTWRKSTLSSECWMSRATTRPRRRSSSAPRWSSSTTSSTRPG